MIEVRRFMLAFWIAPLLLALCAARAAEPEARKPIRVIEIKGSIGQDLVQKVRGTLAEVDERNHPMGALLLIDSSGGDGIAAMELGRLARAARAHVFVQGRCASACVFVLAGGVVRASATAQSIGIHRPRLTTVLKDIGIVDVNPGSNPKAVKALEAANRQAEDYLREMGLPAAMFQAMMAVPSDQMRYPDEAELAELGLLGFDPRYREASAIEAARRYRVAEDEFARRSLRVPRLCLEGKAVAQALIQCYRRVLRTGE